MTLGLPPMTVTGIIGLVLSNNGLTPYRPGLVWELPALEGSGVTARVWWQQAKTG